MTAKQWRVRLIGLCFTVLLTIGAPTHAQETTTSIDANTVPRLQPVAQVDFDRAPAEAGELENGLVFVHPTGDHFATLNRQSAIILWNTDGAYRTHYRVDGEDGFPTQFIDANFGVVNREGQQEDVLLSIHADGIAYKIAVFHLSDESLTVLPFTNDDMPVRIWTDAEGFVWLEVIPADPMQAPYVARFSLDEPEVVETFPSAPEADADAFVRIGRVDAPLAVTATAEGEVTLWNLEKGEIVSIATVGVPPVFGRVNPTTGTHLAWRDPEVEALHLLDFTTGEDRVIAQLDGYAQAILTSPTADVLLAVDVAEEPVVLAWIVETGEQLNLGMYRACGRTPDAIKMSDDGSTLVIGCDTGLDIWRVIETVE